jgi:glutamate 5-kinase
LRGSVMIDAGAQRALVAEGRSLLPIGVTEVQGDYERGEVIAIRSSEGIELGRGLSNYSAADTRRIMRKPSSEIEATLGYIEELELIHRDNLVLR